MTYFKCYIFPTLATTGFLGLLKHKSEVPAVLNRYSIHYAILLVLCALNIGLLWRKAVLGVSYQQFIRRLSPRLLISHVVVVISVLFLIDLVTRNPGQFVILVLLGCVLIQIDNLRDQPIFMSRHVALMACSLMLTAIVFESVFVHVLAQIQTPKSESEFFRLMSSRLPQSVSAGKPVGTFRILGLGDGFGSAGGTTANYHYVLADILRRDGAPTIQMINLSLTQYQPRHELAILRFAMGNSPDLVLHGFYVGNDFSLFGEDMYTYRGIWIKRRPGHSPYRPRHFLIRGWIFNALTVLQEEQERRREEITGLVEEVGGASKSHYLKLQFTRMNRWGKRGTVNVDRMKTIFPVLDAIRSAIEEGGARYVMIIHADHTQVDEQLRREVINTFEVNEEEYDFDLPQKVLMSYCVDRGIMCLDLLPAFRATATRGDLYLLRGTHYNEAGNKLAAANISQFLQDTQLLPKISRTTPVQVHAGK